MNLKCFFIGGHAWTCDAEQNPEMPQDLMNWMQDLDGEERNSMLRAGFYHHARMHCVR